MELKIVCPVTGSQWSIVLVKQVTYSSGPNESYSSQLRMCEFQFCVWLEMKHLPALQSVQQSKFYKNKIKQNKNLINFTKNKTLRGMRL